MMSAYVSYLAELRVAEFLDQPEPVGRRGRRSSRRLSAAAAAAAARLDRVQVSQPGGGRRSRTPPPR